ncbi:MAG: His/Gly/Thr/Pro-type tRNA ligase C-terminal domain-containing protein, partial [Nanoarchaeota archaeon]
PWQTSWGISTRLIGAIVMMHSDDKGLVLPPKVAAVQVVVVPILFEDSKEKVLKAAHKIVDDLIKEGVRVHLDDRTEYSPGWKFNEWEMKGIPLRIEIGPKDLEKNECVVKRRDIAGYGKGGILTVSLASLKKEVPKQLHAMQLALFDTAKKHLEENTATAVNWDEFVAAIKAKKWVKVYFHESEELESEIKEKTSGVTSRCILLDSVVPSGAKCFYSGKDATVEVIFGRNY